MIVGAAIGVCKLPRERVQVIRKHFLRKEIKNSIDNENLLKEEDRILVRKFIDKLKKELFLLYIPGPANRAPTAYQLGW